MSTDNTDNTELAPVDQQSNLPAFMQNDTGGSGIEDMGNYIIPPRIKIVQDKKEDERFEDMPGGDVIVLPQLLRICGKNEAFHFTPIYSWDSFAIHNPYKMRQTLPFIREQTVDRKHEIAIKCLNRAEDFPCPERPDGTDYTCKYVTHLNFLFAIHNVPELAGIEVAMSFFIGEFMTGQNLLNLIRLRTNGGGKMYGLVFEARPAKHSKGTNNWFGLDISNPSADSGMGPFVPDATMYESFKALHTQAKENKARFQFEPDTPSDEAAGPAPESDTL